MTGCVGDIPALDSHLAVVGDRLDRIVDNEADQHDGHHGRDRVRETDEAEPVRTGETLETDRANDGDT